MNAKDKFEEQAYFNKWLKELTEDERDHVIDMMESYYQAKSKEEAEERYKMAEVEATKYATHKEKIGDSETNVYDVRVKLAFMRGAKWILAAFGKEGE